MKKSEMESINSMICSASAMLAWRASKASSPLHGLFKDMMPLGNTRSKAAGKLEVPAPKHEELGALEHGCDLECHHRSQGG